MFPIMVHMPNGMHVNSYANEEQFDAMDYLTMQEIKLTLEQVASDQRLHVRSHAGPFIQSLTDQALEPPLSRIKLFLDEDPDISGGTIGNPLIQPPFVAIVRTQLCAALSRQSRLCFCPPLNNEYTSTLLIARYLYVFTWR